TGEHEVGEDLRERLIDVAAAKVVVEVGDRGDCLRYEVVEIGDWILGFRRRRGGENGLGEGRGQGLRGRCGRHEGGEKELYLLQVGTGRRRAGELRCRTQNVRNLKVEARRTAGGEDRRRGALGSSGLTGEEARLEQPALIGVGALE